MRVSQLRDTVNSYGSGSTSISTVGIKRFKHKILEKIWFHRLPHADLYIFCKDAIDRVSLSTLSAIRARGGKIACDYIDKDLSNFDFSKIDAHIASSNSQLSYLRKHVPEEHIHLLLHQSDARLHDTNSKAQLDRAFYFGEEDNIEILPTYESFIDQIPYTREMNESDIQTILKYKFQYCVRPQHQYLTTGIFKPATKVMNSIAMGIPPIVSSHMEEEISILGQNYPYITNLDKAAEDGKIALENIIADPDMYAAARNQIIGLQPKLSPELFACNFEEICKKIVFG